MPYRPHNTTKTSTARLMIGGQVFGRADLSDVSQSEPLQHALDAARQKFGHALCLCRRHPLKLQVRLRDGRYHLAVWPNEGPLHDAECTFFRDDLELDGSVNYAAAQKIPASVAVGTPSTDDATPVRRDLRVAMPGQARALPEPPRLAQAKASQPDPRDSAPAAPVMSLKALAMLLWEESALCRWHHSWQRDWGRARYELVQAAHRLQINDTPLESMLFVPRAFRESAKEIINEEWDRFVNGLSRRRPPVALLIAPVRGYVAKDDGQAIVHLRHLRHPVGLSDACNDFVTRDCKAALRQIQANIDFPRAVRAEVDNAGRQPSRRNPEVMGFFLVETTSRGGLWARAGWLLSVHPSSFIPASNPNQVMLVDALIEQGYTFQRALSDVAPMRKTAPDWIVRHVMDPEGAPVPRAGLDILDRGSSPEYLQVRADLAGRMAERGIPTWYWSPTGAWKDRLVPPLPPADRLGTEAARAAVQRLRQNHESDYRYGPSPRFHQ